MSKRKRKAKFRRRIIVTVIVLLAGGGGWYAWREHQKRERPIKIETAEATRRNITESVVATGQLYAVTKVVINPEVAGEIVELPVKEGQRVKQGDLLLRIKPDTYIASRDVAAASYHSASANLDLSQANKVKAQKDFERAEGLFRDELISEAEFLTARNALEVAEATVQASHHGVEQAKARLDQAEEDLAKTRIVAPIDGTVTQLRSEKGERVVGTELMAGTEIMTIAQLEAMEARVEVGEVDVVMIEAGQKARLEVDAFRDDAFHGVVTEIANAANTAQMSNTSTPGASSGGMGQVATKFQVKIRIEEKERFRPGMSVTANIETRSKDDVLAIPLQCVTTRPDKPSSSKKEGTEADKPASSPKSGEEEKDAPRKRGFRDVNELVFVVEGDRVKRVDVKRGISDDNYVEIVEGLTEGQVVVSGSYAAIHRELNDGSLIEISTSPSRSGFPRQK